MRRRVVGMSLHMGVRQGTTGFARGVPLVLQRGQTILSHKILIADNEFLIRWSLTRALSQEGYEVIAVENGQRAIETGRTTHFDFVITDLFMPEMDGWDVLNFFRQTQPPSRVIVITAHGEDDTGRIARERGAWAYLEKPYIIDKIKDLLKGVLKEKPGHNLN